MIALSITTTSVYGQQALITSVALDALPDDFDYEEVYRLDTMFGALSSEIIQVYSPHLLNEGSSLVYNDTGPLDGSNLLKPISVEAVSVTDYRWRAINADASIGVTIIRKSYGFAGSVTDFATSKIYRIFPIDISYSVMLEMPEGTVSCSLGIDDEGNSNSADEPVIDPEECEEQPCPGHVDILIMLTQGARDWLGAYPEAVLDQAVVDLQTSFENSSIVHSVAYKYVDVNFNYSFTSCTVDARILNDDQDMHDLLDNENADIGMLLAPPGTYASGDLACVIAIGPNVTKPMGIIPVNRVLEDYIFTHEVGHLLGGEHDGNGARRVSPACATPYTDSFFNTILGLALNKQRILHFSNPNVEFLGEPTGTPENNNVGHMNTVGCIVADFNPSELITTQIEMDVVDCVLELDAVVSTSSNYTYEWYWNETGFFDNASISSSIGTTGSVSTDEPPITDPCSSFFIHVKVLLNGIVVSQRTIRLNGGLCAPFYACELFSYAPLKISPSNEIERTFVSDMLGRMIFENHSRTNLPNLSEYLSNGMYVISTVFKDGTTKSSLLYISN